VPVAGQGRGHGWYPSLCTQHRRRGGQQSGFTYAVSRHFVDCALEGKRPLVTAEDGLALTRALCAIVQSCAANGAVIEV